MILYVGKSAKESKYISEAECGHINAFADFDCTCSEKRTFNKTLLKVKIYILYLLISINLLLNPTQFLTLKTFTVKELLPNSLAATANQGSELIIIDQLHKIVNRVLIKRFSGLDQYFIETEKSKFLINYHTKPVQISRNYRRTYTNSIDREMLRILQELFW